MCQAQPGLRYEVGTSERWPPGVLLIEMVRSYAEKCGSTREGAALLQ